MNCETEVTECKDDAVCTFKWPGKRELVGLCAKHRDLFLESVIFHQVDLRHLNGDPCPPPDQGTVDKPHVVIGGKPVVAPS